MNTIGFYGKVDLEEIKKLENKGIRFLKKHRKPVYVGLDFINEILKNYKVTCDWECGYEDGIVEFLIDYEMDYDIEPVKKIIQELKGVVIFEGFI